MPRVNPESSFEVSAKHLFRHINDLSALRMNPLLRPYFASAQKESSSALAEIHAQVLLQTHAVCDELHAKGSQLQARRQREIVAALCAGEVAEDTARRLEISRSHYYRERHEISVRVARAFMLAGQARATRSVVSDDPLRLLFRRAEALRDGGCSYEAVSLLEEAYGSVPEEFAKPAVGLALAEELTFLGRRDRAKELLMRSCDLPAQWTEDVTSEWLRDSWALNKARLESQLYRDADAGSALEILAKRRGAEGRSDDVTFDAIFLCGEQYRNAGEYGNARNMLRRLRAMDQRLSSSIAKRQIAISLLAAYCGEDSPDEFGLAERSLRDALELSISSGTVVGALLAMSGLIYHQATSGRDDEAYATAHEALRMGKGVDFEGFLGFIVANVVDSLLRTRYWRAANPLLFEAEKLTTTNSLARVMLKQAQGTFLMRIGRRDKACAVMLEAYGAARRLGNRRLEGLILRERAIALSGSHTNVDRAELMREAVQLIEQYGSTGDLLITYDAAARILADRRSLRLARQAKAAVLSGGGSPMPARIRPNQPRQIRALRLPSRSGSRDGVPV
jgi:hypothetical protein